MRPDRLIDRSGSISMSVFAADPVAPEHESRASQATVQTRCMRSVVTRIPTACVAKYPAVDRKLVAYLRHRRSQDTVPDSVNGTTCTTRSYALDKNSNRDHFYAFPDDVTNPDTGHCTTATTAAAVWSGGYD
jgi:hypothetical protein